MDTEPLSILKTKFHFIFWTVFFLYNYLSNTVLDAHFLFTPGNILSYVFFFISVPVFNFYATVYYLNTIKYNKIKIILGTGLLLLFLITTLGLALFNRKFLQPLLINNTSPINYSKYITFWSFQFVYYFAFGSAYFFVREFMKEKINSTNLEKEKINIEANLFRSQINPHFLFNTLNVLYARSIVYSEDLADKIQKLSEIMRYAYLPKWMKDGSHAPLEEEIKHIRNIISIHEFRLGGGNIFNLNIEGNFSQVYLPPLILITLIENMLKHGHFNSDIPATVYINIRNQRLIFEGKNKVKTATNHEEKSGVGIANIISRLERNYPHKYSLASHEENGYFHTNLMIDLS